MIQQLATRIPIKYDETMQNESNIHHFVRKTTDVSHSYTHGIRTVSFIRISIPPNIIFHNCSKELWKEEKKKNSRF